MSELKDLTQILHKTGESLIKETAISLELDCDFVVSVSPVIDSEYAIVVEAGNPPVITLSSPYLFAIIFEDDAKKRKEAISVLKRKLKGMVKIIPRMQRTLSIVPIAEAVASSVEARRMVKTAFPERVIHKIPIDFLRYEFLLTVTLTEINTGISVTLTGSNESILKAKALAQLTSLVAMSELLREKIKQHEFVPDYRPCKITMKASPTEDKIEYTYD